MCIFAPQNKRKLLMKYRIKKETNPTRPTCGKYKAVAVHYHTVDSKQLIKETAQHMGTHTSNVLGVLSSVAAVVNSHLREGDRVRLPDWGMMKLEIESEKVDNLKDFRAKKHIRGVRLHFLPESYEGRQELYEGITFEKDKNYTEE
jgi:nucleoid DNA-binding protein